MKKLSKLFVLLAVMAVVLLPVQNVFAATNYVVWNSGSQRIFVPTQNSNVYRVVINWNWSAPKTYVQTAPTVTQKPVTAPTPAPVPAPTPKPVPAPTPAPVPAPSIPGFQLSASEQEMIRLVNEERAKVGVAPLKIDVELSRVARIKSQDMRDNNYFSHTSPTYGSPFDMMKSFGITYRTAGENLAKHSSVISAHNGLMNSDGHRKNILNPSFTHIGIGIVDDRYYTQMFVGR